MYLDETILQSRTTLSLVEYIEELWKFLDNCDIEMNGGELKYNRLSQKYHIIKDRANKASKKRSFI